MFRYVFSLFLGLILLGCEQRKILKTDELSLIDVNYCDLEKKYAGYF